MINLYSAGNQYANAWIDCELPLHGVFINTYSSTLCSMEYSEYSAQCLSVHSTIRTVGCKP